MRELLNDPMMRAAIANAWATTVTVALAASVMALAYATWADRRGAR
jgi:hypothetical protein